jgi:hypothetical protein
MAIPIFSEATHAEPAQASAVSAQRPRPSFAVAVVVACAVVAAGQRLYASPGHDAEDVWLGFALSAALWSWLWFGCSAAQRFLPRPAALVALALSGVAFYLSLIAELAYTYFYKVAENRELSLLCVGVLPGLRVLFSDLLTPRGILTVLGLIALAHIAALLWTWRGPTLRLGKLAYALPPAITLVATVGGIVVPERMRSPLADLGRELLFLATTPQLDLASAQKLPFAPKILDKASADDPSHHYAFDNVLIFVMETMITRDFKDESSKLPAETFVHRVLPNTHRYTDYHSNNQDSRTGMLDMLQSRVIPYEAYADGVDHYRFVSRLPSMVDRFNARGYETAYVVSHADREDVISDLAWKRVTLLPEKEVDALRSKLLCVTIYEFEYGCEDRAMLPKVFQLLDENPKTFLYQEFIWGHDPEYNEISGRSNADYYSAYLDAIVEHLRETNKLDRTLIVLTSDHGYRGRATLGEPYAYQIPLWFYATRFSEREDHQLFSHINFQDLLLHELGVRPAPQPDPFVAVVGPTGISSLTVLDAAGELALIRTRGTTNFLLSRRAAPSRKDFTFQPAAYARLLEDYRGHFAALDAPK